MKLKTLVIGGSGLFLMVFSLLLFVAILFSDEQDSGISNIHYGGVNVSAEVLAHKPMVEKYAKEYGVEELCQHTSCDLYRWNRAVLRKMLCSPRNPSVFHLIH